MKTEKSQTPRNQKVAGGLLFLFGCVCQYRQTKKKGEAKMKIKQHDLETFVASMTPDMICEFLKKNGWLEGFSFDDDYFGLDKLVGHKFVKVHVPKDRFDSKWMSDVIRIFEIVAKTKSTKDRQVRAEELAERLFVTRG